VIVWSHNKLDGTSELTNNICTLHLVWSAPRPGDVVSNDTSTSSEYGTWRGTKYKKYTDAAKAERQQKRRKKDANNSSSYMTSGYTCELLTNGYCYLSDAVYVLSICITVLTLHDWCIQMDACKQCN
jgi:hypothetical protein